MDLAPNEGSRRFYIFVSSFPGASLFHCLLSFSPIFPLQDSSTPDLMVDGSGGSGAFLDSVRSHGGCGANGWLSMETHWPKKGPCSHDALRIPAVRNYQKIAYSGSCGRQRNVTSPTTLGHSWKDADEIIISFLRTRPRGAVEVLPT